jgi:Rod binding domain-containing protein
MSAIPSSLPMVSPGMTTPAVPSSRGAKAAQQFEAQLIGSMLESMEKTFASLPGEDQLPGSDDYNYLGMHALAETLAAHGGFGIAALIARSLPADVRQPTSRSVHEGKD